MLYYSFNHNHNDGNLTFHSPVWCLGRVPSDAASHVPFSAPLKSRHPLDENGVNSDILIKYVIIFIYLFKCNGIVSGIL